MNNFGGGAQHYNTISHDTNARTELSAPNAIQKSQRKEELNNHYKFHKGTTYTIGKSGSSNDKAFKTLTNMDFVEKPRANVMASRFNQEESTGIRN